MAKNPIIAKCEAMGIDYERLNACMNQKDNWGDMIHSFEYLTVLGAVCDEMRKEANG